MPGEGEATLGFEVLCCCQHLFKHLIKGEGIRLSALPKVTASGLTGLFSTLIL